MKAIVTLARTIGPLIGLGLVAACMPTAEPIVAGQSLAGTHWQLAELQSMDDAIGTTVLEEASLYTMTLNEDGTANLRLDCNRANGSWSFAATSDASGSFSLGPLAMTRAACPPGSLDQRMAREAEFVRSYLLRDGRLYLSLMADGGIQVWEPAGAP